MRISNDIFCISLGIATTMFDRLCGYFLFVLRWASQNLGMALYRHSVILLLHWNIQIFTNTSLSLKTDYTDNHICRNNHILQLYRQWVFRSVRGRPYLHQDGWHHGVLRPLLWWCTAGEQNWGLLQVCSLPFHYWEYYTVLQMLSLSLLQYNMSRDVFILL